MSEPRLKTDIWIKAHLRRCMAEAVPAVIARKGDPDAGGVILRVNLLDGTSRVRSLTRDMDGAIAWIGGLGGDARPDAEVEGYIARQVDRDPDVWVVEIEHRHGWHPFEGAML